MSKTMPLILAVPTGSGLADTDLANYKNARSDSFVAVAKGTTYDIFTGQKLIRSGNVVETASADALAVEMISTCECAKCKHTTFTHVSVTNEIIDKELTQIHCAACGVDTSVAIDTHAYIDAELALYEEEAEEQGPGAKTAVTPAPKDDYADDKMGGNKIEDEATKVDASSETYQDMDTPDEADKETSPETVKATVTLNPVGMEGANDANSDPGTDDASGMDDQDPNDEIDPDAGDDDYDWDDDGYDGDDSDSDDGSDGSDQTDDDEGEGDEMDGEGASGETIVLKAKLIMPTNKEAASSKVYKLDAPGEADIVSNPATVVTKGEDNDSNFTGDENLPGNNDMPGEPRGSLEISSKLPATADFRGDLVHLAMHGDPGTRVAYVFYHSQPVGTLEEAKAIESIKPSFDDINKLHRGFVVAASMDASKDYGFQPFITKVEIPDVTAKEVAKVQAEFDTKLNEAITANAERFRQSLSIAALASVKGVWQKIKNPVRDQLISTLEVSGFEGATAVVDGAFASGGEDFIKSLLTAALEYSAKSDVVREEIAHMVKNADSRSGVSSVALEMASTLTKGSMRIGSTAPVNVHNEVLSKEIASRVPDKGGKVSFLDSYKKLRA